MAHIKTFRHNVLSMFQSAIDGLIPRGAPEGSAKARRPDMTHAMVQAAVQICEHKDRGETAPKQAPSGLVASLGKAAETAWTSMSLLADLFEAKIKGEHDKAQEIKDELVFSNVDPKWVEAIEDYLNYFGLDRDKREIPYIRYANINDFVLDTLPPNATIALLGDWATGTSEAVELLKQVNAKHPDVVIHLGDVYYSGTHNENQGYFLGVLDEVLDRSRVAVYSLTGNHDMYSGGVGYYDMIKELNLSLDPKHTQPASYFSLRTTDGAWQFLSMDTGLHDSDPFEVADAVTYLDPREEAWHLDKLANFEGRTILLSHHQLFSAFEHIGKLKEKPDAEKAFNPKLLASFRQFQKQGDIAAWFWGHEHNMCVYQPYAPLDKGRCIGHGAIPVFLEQDPYKFPSDIPNPPQLVEDPNHPGQKLMLAKDDEVYAHGYVIISLDNRSKTAQVDYYQETDEHTPMYTETL